MFNIKTLGAAAPNLLAAIEAVALPGHDIKAEASQCRSALSSFERRSLSHCQEKPKARGVHDKNIARRHNMAEKLRKRHLVKRDLATFVNMSHASSLIGITPQTDPSTTQGPYYVSQEFFRSYITEDQLGVVDTETCEPLSGVAVDFCVMQFISIVPGHYTSRATHVHLLAHSPGNWSLLENGNITGGTSTSHVAKIFFDQDLLETVEATAPYNTNTQELTQNSEDSIRGQEAEDDMDPFAEYVVLDENDITAGVFSWLTIEMNASATYSVSPAAVYAPTVAT
ncbi:aromatic compound dioxygenase [Phyllosticta citriasiana]|uniref:aromatic compound dioxygenase n=1 Tax=Phyllosticta citriasiana TaxID=595635 RepID=UPI0030FD95A3